MLCYESTLKPVSSVLILIFYNFKHRHRHSMAYRRRHGLSRASTFKEELHPLSSLDDVKDSVSDHDNNASPSILPSNSSSPPSYSSLAAQAMKSSSSRRQPSLSFAFAPNDHQRSKSFEAYGNGNGNGNNKSGFWGVLAQKAKSILDDDKSPPSEQHSMSQTLKSRSFNNFTGPSAAQNSPSQFTPLHQSPEFNRKMDNPTFRKGLDAITSSLNQLGDTFEKAFEEGRTIVESKTADLRTQMRRKGNNSGDTNQTSEVRNPLQQQQQQQQPTQTQTQNQSNHETQLKASRDVRWQLCNHVLHVALATAAKAKLLLRELKTVKADLVFAKARCAQLEGENKVLRDREGTEKGHSREDDDLIRHQLETLLAEKARLANENETYSRENRFLREIVEYHQLTMQDVVYIDEGMGEVSEVYPVDMGGITHLLSVSSHSSSPSSPHEPVMGLASPPMLNKDIFSVAEEEEEDTRSTSEDEGHHPITSVSQHPK
ncbi:hypothetical protein VNO77_20784 [Canavalia gladiata]|uniref:Uncharacterized protein n=1 Tax=Canavalia gladiata TaxID=3824 RepID=A0AAN9LPW0_CANGL